MTDDPNTRATPDSKAGPRGARYAPEERVQVIHPAGDVLATVPDRAETHLVRWSPEAGWTCSCRARSAACGHIASVRRVVILDPDQGDPANDQEQQ